MKIKIFVYKTSIILPLILYGCETWSPTLMDEQDEYLDIDGRRNGNIKN
jgi:hypothetical protein